MRSLHQFLVSVSKDLIMLVCLHVLLVHKVCEHKIVSMIFPGTRGRFHRARLDPVSFHHTNSSPSSLTHAHTQ